MRSGRFVSTWNVCCGAAAMTVKTRAMNSSGISSWKRSLIELTNTRRGLRQRSGSSSTSSCSVTPNAGPDPRRGSPSRARWYFALPIARSRGASSSA
jgi:hypothetical protein